MESETPQPAPSKSFPSREDCWTVEATSTLVDAWSRRYMEQKRGNLRHKDWQEVADAVNALHGHTSKSRRTDVQCKNRIDTLKKKYKTEKAKIADCNGALTSSWPFFSRLDALIGSSCNKLQIDQPEKMTPVDLMNSPLMAVPLPFSKPLETLSLPPLLPQLTATPPQLKLEPVILPQKRPPPVTDNSEFKRNYSAVVTAAAKPVEGKGESSVEELENEAASEGLKVEADCLKMLAKAIERFGDIYERVERKKQKEMAELEKQRIQFAKELEIQRMQLLMDTQVKLAKLKQAKRAKQSASDGELVEGTR